MLEAQSRLVNRLQNPSRRLTPSALSQDWFHQIVRVTLPGYGALAKDLALINRIRGAWGHELMRSAPPEAIAGKPCPWEPPCALDIFFREQFRDGKHGLPKPFLFGLNRRRRDLIVDLTIFGLASDWAFAARDALVVALKRRLDWKRHYPDLFLPADPAMEVELLTLSRMPEAPRARHVEIEFLTPMDASGDDPIDNPATVIGRLARRIDGLARWQEARIDADWAQAAKRWSGLEYDARGLRYLTGSRGSRRQNREIPVSAVAGTLSVHGDLAEILPLLLIGQTSHVGRGAVSGYGRFEIVSME